MERKLESWNEVIVSKGFCTAKFRSERVSNVAEPFSTVAL